MEMRGSDLYVKVGSAPRVRIDGHLHPAPFPPLDPAQTDALVRGILPHGREAELAAVGEADFAHSVPGVGRFRVHAYKQRGSLAVAFRRVMSGVPDWDRLALPPVLGKITQESRGLVLVTRPAGSGKTTTVHALRHHNHQQRAPHLLTV